MHSIIIGIVGLSEVEYISNIDKIILFGCFMEKKNVIIYTLYVRNVGSFNPVV